jgi:hypothetical protein
MSDASETRLAEALRGDPRWPWLTRENAALMAAAVAPLVDEARAEGWVRGMAEGGLVARQKQGRDDRPPFPEEVQYAREQGYAEGYAARGGDAQAAIKAITAIGPDDRKWFMRVDDALDAVASLGKANTAKTCAVCGKETDKLYGGMGRYLCQCYECWTSECRCTYPTPRSNDASVCFKCGCGIRLGKADA